MWPLGRARVWFTPRLSPDPYKLQQGKRLPREQSVGSGEEQVEGLMHQPLGVWRHRY